jgi:hypothetical protein
LSRAQLEASIAATRSPRIAEELTALDPKGRSPFRVIVREREPVRGSARRLTEIHNRGCAISGAALSAFKQERGGLLSFEDVELPTLDLGLDVRERFALEGAVHRYVLARRSQDDTPFVLFHRAGRIEPVAPEAGGSPIEVWEAILADSPFARIVFGAFGALGAFGARNAS